MPGIASPLARHSAPASQSPSGDQSFAKNVSPAALTFGSGAQAVRGSEGRPAEKTQVSEVESARKREPSGDQRASTRPPRTSLARVISLPSGWIIQIW